MTLGRINTTLITLLLLSCTLLNGQELRLERISNDLGLSQNTINAIFQDQQGFLWVGTNDGLNRFDGYHFKVYTFDSFDSLSLSDNRIQAIYESRQGRLWVGTANGLNCFDRKKGHFRRFFADGSANSIPHNSILSISESRDGYIWIGTQNGMARISETEAPAGFQFRQFLHASGQNEQNIRVLAAEEDENGVLWVSTHSAIFQMTLRESPGGYRLEKFDESRLPGHWQSPAARADNRNRVFKGPDGGIWITSGPGIARWIASEGRFETYDMLGSDPDAVLGYWPGAKDITQGHSGKIWVGHFTGLDVFDPEKNEFIQYNSATGPALAGTLEYGVSAVYESRDQILWVGSFGVGLYKYDPFARRFSRKESDNSILLWEGGSVRSILPHSSGKVLVGIANVGFITLDPGNLEQRPITCPSSVEEDWGVVYDMLETPAGEIWIASMSGLFRVSIEEECMQLLEAFTVNNNNERGREASFVYQVLRSLNGDIWIATDSCLGKLDRSTRSFDFFPLLEGKAYTSGFPVLYESADGTIWVGTSNGLLQFDQDSKSFSRYANNPRQAHSLSHNVVKTLHDDPFQPDRYLWAGTAGGGLNRLDRKSGRFQHFMEKEGLPDKVVYGILADEEGHLWLSTNKGLCVFSAKDFSVKNFDSGDGLQDNEFNTYAYHKSADGRMFFGGINGFNAFLPEKVLTVNPQVPSVVLTGLSVDGKPVKQASHSRGGYISSDITIADEIRLSYLNKTIILEFAALHYTKPSMNQYAYKMDGFDHDWNHVGTQRTATYTNLNPGIYTFRVKGASKDGVWSEKAAEVKIVITPPWWRTWWAYTLFALASVLLLAALRQYELGRQQLKNQLLREKLEADSLKEADRLKARFFANISHELRTPLTLILGQIDSLITQDRPEKRNARLAMAQRNAKRLLQLINELLDFSKLEAGRMELHARKNDIIPFLKNTLQSFESMAEEKDITIGFYSDIEHQPLYFENDKMTKVFYNLLSNALKFTPQGGAVSMHLLRESPEQVAIEIRDSGIGIPAELLPKVFDRFFQIDSSNTRRYEGTGIGLALSKELVELHGGSIHAQSRQGEGTCIRVLLPIDPGLEQAPEKEAQPSSEAYQPEVLFSPAEFGTPVIDQAHSKAVEGPQILIVEDNADVRSYLKGHLQDAGFQVLEAADGKEGLDKAADSIPALIITDLMMPRMDGYTFAEKVRSDEKISHIPIVMLTAKASEGDKLQGLQLGIDDYLVKPFSSKELLVRINNLIQLRRQLRERFSKATVIHPSEVSAISKDRVFLQKVLQSIEAHLEDEQFSVSVLADSVAMSANHLNRKLQALIDQSAGQLIRSMRLQRAASLLVQDAANVSEIAYRMGFSSPANFSRSFKNQFGCSPSEYASSSEARKG